MGAKKSAPRRKRAAPAPSGAKKKKTVAVKKKHVRELAKAGRWAEIERLYGKKILAKAKAYSEKNRVVKTPQEIAHEILLKNGYLPSVPRQAVALATTVNRGVGSTPHVGVSARNNTEPHSSPETLTKEQQELIEKRRHDALERRKHAQHATGVNRVQPIVVPMDRVANAAKTLQDGLQSSVGSESELRHRHLQPPPQRIESRRQMMQSRDQTRRTVTPEHHSTTNSAAEAELVRPEYFWDDLEAAAEIVQWEHEHMAEAALEQVPPKMPKGFDRTIQKASGRQTLQDESNTRSHELSSLSQELAAAAEIIQWENEHEISPEAPAHPTITVESSDSDPELETPQFQLLSAHVPIDRHNDPSNQLHSKLNSHRKRPLEAASPPALPRSNADFNKAVNLGGGNSPSSSCPAQAKRDPTAEFIDKHILEAKLELPVLEFLDMMLS